jgi:hypothetical protein
MQSATEIMETVIDRTMSGVQEVASGARCGEETPKSPASCYDGVIEKEAQGKHQVTWTFGRFTAMILLFGDGGQIEDRRWRLSFLRPLAETSQGEYS